MISLLIGLFMMRFVTHPSRPDFKQTREWEEENDYWGDYDSFPKEDWDLVSFDGTVLHGTLIMNPVPSDKFIILTHGYSYNRDGAVKYANIFYKLGYNMYLYDLRYHGANEHEKNYCTMGELESLDLCSVIDAVYERFGREIFLGLHGESLGAATTLLTLGKRQDLAFAIADCPFADLKELLYYQAKQMFHMPKYTVHIANGWYRLLKKHDFFQVMPVDAMRENMVPLMLVHGRADDFIEPWHSQRLYDACKEDCIHELHYMEGAKHARSYGVDRVLYEEWVKAFLSKLPYQLK